RAFQKWRTEEEKCRCRENPRRCGSLRRRPFFSFGLRLRCGQASQKARLLTAQISSLLPQPQPSQLLTCPSLYWLLPESSFSLFLRYWSIPSLSSVGEQWMPAASRLRCTEARRLSWPGRSFQFLLWLSYFWPP